MAKLQAASVPIAIGSCAMGQTDGRIALFKNAPWNNKVVDLKTAGDQRDCGLMWFSE